MTRNLAVIVLLGATLAAPAAAGEAPPLLGFTPGAAEEQVALERRFDDRLSADNLRAWAKRIASGPTTWAPPTARTTPSSSSSCSDRGATRPRSRSPRCCSRRPSVRRVEMLEPHAYTPAFEPRIAEDATSGQRDEQLPTYNAYSVDGDVTGELVYVNHGVPDDYDELDKRGIVGRGQDRHRALRRLVARDQAQGRGGEGRHRLHPLLRPRRRRLLRRRRYLPPRCGTARRRAPSAARWPTCRCSPATR